MDNSSSSLVWLLLRHFPKWLAAEDKENLLEYFGASEVKAMPSSGKMRNCVFAAFDSKMDATLALRKLHQLDVFGSRLVVEFVESAHFGDKWKCNKTPWTEEDEAELDADTATTTTTSTITTTTPIASSTTADSAGGVSGKAATRGRPDESTPTTNLSSSGMSEPSSLMGEGGVKFEYPPVSPAILTNIAQALLTLPEFYTQVLHVMNKMDLPPPFHHPPPIPTPPGLIVVTEPCLHRDHDVGMAEGEESASELESEEEDSEKGKRKREGTRVVVARRPPKRRKVTYQQMKTLQDLKKKKKTTAEPPPPAAQSPDTGGPFSLSRAHIELNVPRELVPAKPEVASDDVHYIESISTVRTCSSEGEKLPPEVEPMSDNSPPAEQHFISDQELASGRLSQKELEEAHVFRKYSPGEPSTRLYIKNLAKQVEDKDLHYIFGKYCNWNDKNEVGMFDVRLMQSGKMKGQAFVSLPDNNAASVARKETNGFLLHGKPMVVHFARSTKPKLQV